MQSQLDRIEMKLDLLIDVMEAIPEWIPVSHALAEHLGYTRQGVINKMMNHLEPEREYKKIGVKWHVHKSSVWKLERKRRRKNV